MCVHFSHARNVLLNHFQKFCQEAVIWKHLRHPNILTLLGVSLETDKWAMISEWMDNGDINKFVKEYAEANRAQLVST